MEQPVILSAVRTPIGKFQGGLSPLSATELGAKVVAEAVRRADIAPNSVDEVIMGCVLPAGLGQNPARQAALNGGLDPRVAAMTINKVCGSGLKAVSLAAQGVMLGEIEVGVAGGMESMSNSPYLLPGARNGYRLGNAELIDSMIHDGLWDAFNDFHMGQTAELVAEKYKNHARRAGPLRPRKPPESRSRHAVLLFRSANRSRRNPAEKGRVHRHQQRRIPAPR